MILILDNKEASISKPYHDGIAQQILLEKGGKVALSSQLTDQLRARSSIPFKSDQRVKSIISKIPDTKITSFNRSGRRIFVIDSDAIIKPPNLFTLLR